MHESSYQKMALFVEKYLTGFKNENIKVLDIGSTDINGSYKNLFENKNWQYHGADIQSGNNVDIILKNGYDWKNILSNSYDVVISGQALEHIEYFWVTILEIARVLKSGGLCCIIAPSGGVEHKYPLDCWRFYPDGFKSLARYANLEALEVYAEFEPEKYSDASEMWMDCVLIAKKLPYHIKRKYFYFIKSYLAKLLLKF